MAWVVTPGMWVSRGGEGGAGVGGVHICAWKGPGDPWRAETPEAGSEPPMGG